MVSKFIAGPLTIIVLLSITNMCGLGSGNFSPVTQIGGSGDDLYDSTGTLIFFSNLTVNPDFPNPDYYLLVQGDNDGENTQYAYFTNSSYESSSFLYKLTAIRYPLYTDENAVNQAYWQQVGAIGDQSFKVNMYGSLGLIALVIALMAVALVAGLNIFGSGVNDSATNTIFMCTAWLAVWGVFSVLAFSLLALLGNWGIILYFVLTIVYTIGIIDSVGNSGGEA